ncbi:hypothetical protein D3C72_2464250 [compost metagenome]
MKSTDRAVGTPFGNAFQARFRVAFETVYRDSLPSAFEVCFAILKFIREMRQRYTCTFKPKFGE